MSMNDPSEIQKRLLKYFVPVVLLSVAINVPKFFETEAFFVEFSSTDANNVTSAYYEVELNVTSMRVDPIYSTFVNWSQLFILGIVPVCLLVYFNFKIYVDIRERERRRRPKHRCSHFRSSEAVAAIGGECNGGVTPTTESNRLVVTSFFNKIRNSQRSSREKLSPSAATPSASRPSSPNLRCISPSMRSSSPSFLNTTTATSSPKKMSNAKRRKVEDRMAILFMGIVAAFFLCHFPRILLNFYEMLVIERAMACTAAGQRGFAVWAQVLTSVNNFLLVFNSSINILIYVVFNTKFREAATELLKPLVAAICAARKPKIDDGGPAAVIRHGDNVRPQNV